jgi:hypothetical protein
MTSVENGIVTKAVRFVVDRTLLWAFVGFLFIACWMGWDHGRQESWVWGVVAICAILLEVGSIHKFFEAKATRQWTVAASAAALWVVAFAYSFVQSLAVASGTANEAALKRVDTVAAKVQVEQAVDSTQIAKNKAQAKVDHLISLSWKPVPSIDGIEIRTELAADSIVTKLQGDRLFARSKRCTDTSLPDSRELCGKIALAVAAKSDVAERAKLAAELKVAEADLVKATQTHVDAVMKSQNTKSTSKASGFQQVAGRWFGVDAETVNDGVATQRTVTLNIALTLTALLLFGGAVGSTGIVPPARRNEDESIARPAPSPAPVNDNADVWRAIRSAINQPAKAS